MPMLWIQSRVDYILNLPQILSKRQLSNNKHNQPFIILQSVWILQSLNTLGSTKTTFSDENAMKTITIKYTVVNVLSSYNLLLGRLSLNRLGIAVSTSHLKLKLPSPEGKVITMRVDKKVARKCYENSLRSRRGTYTITSRWNPIKNIVIAKFVH